MDETLKLRSARGRGVLFASVVGSGIAFLDQTVVNVALPTLQSELGADLTQLQWTVDAYLLFLGALLLVGGALGDRFGRRRIFIVGLAAFALASALCGFAPSADSLIAARALQGMGAALLVPSSLALVRASFDEADTGAAIGAWTGLSGVTTALGPLLGGWFIETWSYRAIFFINPPLALLGIWAALRYVPESRDASAPARIDWPGATLATLALAGIVFALIEGPQRGWSGGAVAAAGIGVGCAIAFVVVERRRPTPMVPLDLFASLQFRGANLATLAIYFALSGVFFLLVLQLQHELGYSPLAAGAALTPVTVLVLVLSPLSGKLGSWIGYRWPMTLGPLIAAVGAALLVRAQPGGAYTTHVLPGLLVLGVGLGTTVAPLTTAVFAAAPASHAGMASGVNNAIARIAGLLAVALLPSLAGIGATASPAGFAHGFGRAMWICAGTSALGALFAFATVERRGSATSRR
jgi:EmrB/QacA subfamily drug resistance transporter